MENDKETLKRYVEQIASLFLNKFEILNYEIIIAVKGDYKILDTEIWLGDFACIIKLDNLQSLTEIKKSLTKLLNKTVFINFDGFLYWFEGEKSFQSKNSVGDELIEGFINNSIDCEIEKLKTDTRLPKWLDNFIFDKLKANYSPDFKRYSNNLEFTDEEVKVYLGTYFPRSYAESFCIVNDLLQNEEYFSSIKIKTTISILDIGSGTGGNLVGLLYAFRRNIITLTDFRIIAIDGNTIALEYLKIIIDAFAKEHELSIHLTIINKIVNSSSEIASILSDNTENTFDWIVSSKMVGEIIQFEGENLNSYYRLLEICLPKLLRTGILLLLDVTTKLSNMEYLPLLLNRQTNSYLNKNQIFKTLSPICCGKYGNNCTTDCFHQQTFRITHSTKRQDISKVAYRLIGYSEFTNSILKKIKNGNSIIRWVNRDNKYISGERCIFTLAESETIDAYKLH